MKGSRLHSTPRSSRRTARAGANELHNGRPHRSSCGFSLFLLVYPDQWVLRMKTCWRVYCTELATEEKTLFALLPTRRIVPTTITRITASITAYSAISCPLSSLHKYKGRLNIRTPLQILILNFGLPTKTARRENR